LYAEGIIVGLKKKLRNKDKKIEQLEQKLCPKCKEAFIEIFEDSKK